MSKSKVYFFAVSNGENDASMADKAVQLADVAGLAGTVTCDRPCAIKQHFGEAGNKGYIKPPITRAVVDWVTRVGGWPFVTDTNTLYTGRRNNAIDHMALAHEHGFTHNAIRAPIIIADGLLGADQITVPITGGKHFKEVRIASAGHEAASAIVLSHVKGHCLSGMGGAIKNIGMGFAARAGKLAQHHEGYPLFDHEKCRGCGVCARRCPTEAIQVRKKAEIDAPRCIGCGECLVLCPHDAIGFSWDAEGPVLIERICEHALGFLTTKRGRVGFLNFLTHVTQDCDCTEGKQKVLYPDVGIFASTDVVAVDKAAADMALTRYGKDIWLDWWPDSHYTAQFEYGAKLGLGSMDYDLVTL
ncbi:MAG: hypothetical protein A3K19_18585 [Lentisphaerae bacterium RIFOXYB12_FULL_65_16]|nr:MAG: hypothetical protein A3K18_01015 [Lentisphaerae bacterium RIFOXYA12_64_32]OGV92353.1 MAG: hypothetical protein A3K19_18585 [Lentisphaerae bacterium RIFOXYB12_FULL_65_16]